MRPQQQPSILEASLEASRMMLRSSDFGRDFLNLPARRARRAPGPGRAAGVTDSDDTPSQDTQ